MSQEILNKRIKTTNDLRGIVSTMKMLSSVSVGQFEKALKSLKQCNENLYLAFQGLFVQENFQFEVPEISKQKNKVLAIVIGSDNGLVGRFNRDVIKKMQDTLYDQFPQSQIKVITVGKRLAHFNFPKETPKLACYNNSNTIKEISPLSNVILAKIHHSVSHEGFDSVWLFYTSRQATGLKVQAEQLIPFQKGILENLKTKKWTGRSLPLVTADYKELFSAFIHEYFTLSVTHALTASLASEHYTRMIHMQQAEKNIDEKLNELELLYQQMRQNQITDELIDIVSGAEAISKIKTPLDKSVKNA